jgi:IS5 family transposase
MIADKIEALLADKGYDADAIREELTKADVEAVIPAKSNRRGPSRTTAKNIAGATSSSACSTSSRTGGASQHDTTKPNLTSALSISCQSCNGYPLSTKPKLAIIRDQ